MGLDPNAVAFFLRPTGLRHLFWHNKINTAVVVGAVRSSLIDPTARALPINHGHRQIHLASNWYMIVGVNAVAVVKAGTTKRHLFLARHSGWGYTDRTHHVLRVAQWCLSLDTSHRPFVSPRKAGTSLTFSGTIASFTDDWSMHFDGIAVGFKNKRTGTRHLL